MSYQFTTTVGELVECICERHNAMMPEDFMEQIGALSYDEYVLVTRPEGHAKTEIPQPDWHYQVLG